MPSYEKRPAGWSVRFREFGADGLEHTKRLSGFSTKKAAQYAYEDYQAKRMTAPPPEPEAPPNPADVLFEDLLAEYFAFQQNRVKESTYYDETSKFRVRITPFFTGRKLSEISAKTILQWQATLDGLSYKYRSDLHNYLSHFFHFAERYHDIPNVMEKIDRPRNLEPKKEMEIWTPEEFSRFIGAVSAPDYQMFFRVLYITGCRRGEALALTWEDVDFEKCEISITKTVTFKLTNGDRNYKITTPKNVGSNRTVTIPRYLADDLRVYRAWQSANKPAQAFLFSGDRPLPPTSIDRVMANACASADVPKIRIHDIRHSCASLLIHKGVSIVAVSRRLGHSNIEQTLNTYSHMMPDDQSVIRGVYEDLSDLLK